MNKKDNAAVAQLLRHYQIECGPLNLIHKNTLESSITKALITVRQEAFKAARDAMQDPLAGTGASVEFHRAFEAFRRLAISAIYRVEQEALEAAANSVPEDEGEGVEDHG